MNVVVYGCVCSLYICVYAGTYIHIYICICMYMYVYIYACVYVYLHVLQADAGHTGAGI